MRKTSEELNSEVAIENIWELCGEIPETNEFPHWETINRYPGNEKPLLSDPDRPYDLPGNGVYRKTLETRQSKQGAETPKDSGIL